MYRRGVAVETSKRLGLDLRSVRVRPIHGTPGHRRRSRFMATGHYQLFQGLSGKGARYVATLGETWIALPDRGV